MESDLRIIDNNPDDFNEDDMLMSETQVDITQGVAMGNRRGTNKGKLEKTWIDSDDDDEEFEYASKEEEEDIIDNDVSAFMFSRPNISRYHDPNRKKAARGPQPQGRENDGGYQPPKNVA